MRLAKTLARSKPEAALPLRLCIAFTELVGADGGSISMDFSSTDRLILCATDARSARIEDAQDVLREGPSLDAFRTGAAVTGLPLEEQATRWPLLEEIVTRDFAGTALHAFPVTPDGQVMGAVLVHLSGDHDLAISPQHAQLLANAVGIALLGELDVDSLAGETWSARDRVDQATGMVTAQLHVTPADARAVLRAHAYAHETSLAEVSSMVLARDLSFTDLDSSDGSDT